MESGNIQVIEAESNFKKVHRSIINNSNIDCQTLGLYVKIITFGKAWQLNINGLSKHLDLSDNKIRSSIKTLEREGYITRHSVKGEGGKFLGWNYKVYCEPVDERTNAGSRTYQKTDTPLNGQDRKRTRPKTDKTENGEENNNRLNLLLDLNKTIDSNKIESEKFFSQPQQPSNDSEFVQFEGIKEETTSVSTSSEAGEKKVKPSARENERSFIKALVEIGVCEEAAEEWAAIRRKKRGSNTVYALKQLVKQFQLTGLSFQECVDTAIRNSWVGFEAAWINKLNNNGNGFKTKREQFNEGMQELLRGSAELHRRADEEFYSGKAFERDDIPV